MLHQYILGSRCQAGSDRRYLLYFSSWLITIVVLWLSFPFTLNVSIQISGQARVFLRFYYWLHQHYYSSHLAYPGQGLSCTLKWCNWNSFTSHLLQDILWIISVLSTAILYKQLRQNIHNFGEPYSKLFIFKSNFLFSGSTF